MIVSLATMLAIMRGLCTFHFLLANFASNKSILKLGYIGRTKIMTCIVLHCICGEFLYVHLETV